jgi:hypothetical protein
MAIYCFECGVEVSESQKIVRNGRVFCSQTHAANTRQTAAPPQVKSATQPKPPQNPPSPTPAAEPAQPGTSPKATTNPPAAPGKIAGKP